MRQLLCIHGGVGVGRCFVVNASTLERHALREDSGLLRHLNGNLAKVTVVDLQLKGLGQ